MRLDAEAVDVESFHAVASDAAQSPVRPNTGSPTAATLCEFCASDSGCW